MSAFTLPARRVSFYLTLLLAAAFAVGCSNEDAVPSPSLPSLVANSECPDVSLETDRGQPLDAVAVELGDGVGVSWLQLTSGDETLVVPIVAGADGSHFYVPVHPAGIDGGELFLQVTDGERVCPPRPFIIDPLDRAPGAAAGLVGAMHADSMALLDSVGLDEAAAETLVDFSVPGTIVIDDERESAIAPLLFAALIDHPENPQSLTRLAGQDNEILDALMNKAGMIDSLGQQPMPVTADGSVAALAAGPPIHDAASLSHYLTDVGRPACNVGASHYGDLVTTIGVLAGQSPDPTLRAGLTSFATTGTALMLLSAYNCATHPNQVTEIAARPGRLDFEEDSPGKRLAVELTAVAGPAFNLPRRLADVVLAALAVQGATAAEGAAPIVDSLMRTGGDALFTWSLERGTGSEEAVSVHGGPWTVGVDSQEWLEIYPHENRVRVEDCADAGICVVPTETGDEALNIAPKPEAFGSVVLVTTVETPVHVIDVDLGPRVRIASPGFAVPLGYAVRNAIDPSLSFWSSAPDFVGEETTSVDGDVMVHLPADLASYPVSVIAESTSRGGLRESGIPARVADVLFVLGDMEVSPNGRCVRPGETLRLHASARYVDGTEAQISWASPYVDGRGLFTAPSQAGEYEVVATASYLAVGSPIFTDTVTVRVGDCGCWYDIEIEGADAMQLHGEFNFRITSSSVGGGRVYKTIMIDGPANVVMSYVRPQGPTPERAVFEGQVAVVSDHVGGPGAIELSKTPSGHFMAEFVGEVENRDTGSTSFARFTFHGVDEDAIIGVSCSSADEYRAPDTND